ncbi:MAG: hypothetical protein KBD66_03165 [Candidatus Doudnabacteria bacterium]|nr:hypothetical protein [Candidatus Doudnabacteria bacterium]
MNVQERIIKTLELFALQSVALTAPEVGRFLVQDPGLLSGHMGGRGELISVPSLADEIVSELEIRRALGQLVEEGALVERYGFYTTSDRKDVVLLRWQGHGQGVWREKRIRRFLPLFRYIPFVRGVALAGSQVLGVVKQASDIDLFIITDPRWLWLPRTLVTAFFHFLGIRRYRSKIARRVCLNHYISGQKYMQTGRNWYTAMEYVKLRPLFGEAYIRHFQNSNGDWLRTFFPNVLFPVLPVSQARGFQKYLEQLITLLGGKKLEQWLGAWQSKRIHKDERHIIVTSDELSFHPHSKQDAIVDAFK